ncbi:MAG TPA: alpha/beta fold hydrolase [Nocardioidaceae bacterium]|nr:alpha/beta fold hydrolase [Nocardioidaceae bacterium]
MLVYKGDRVVESGAARLSVREYGGRGPHVVFVHGYPDDQSLWEGVLARLSGVHAVTYDVRGAGSSTAPDELREFRNDRLVDDLVAVVEATIPPGAPFHLVGHDWGSIQLWDAVVDPRLSGRIASFVSASGPSIDHVAVTLRSMPTGLASQMLHSFYIAAFQIPWLPERLWRSEHRLTPRMVGILAAQGGARQWSPALAHNAASHVRLYRANMVPKLLRPRPKRVEVPVLLVVATRDNLVGPAYLQAIARHCHDLTTVEIDAPHWHPMSQPELLAGVLTDHLAQYKKDMTPTRRSR